MATTADALLREAHERGYRFPAGFDGFTARAGWETPAGSGESTVEVRLGSETPVETSELDDWASGELRSMVAHRSPRPYDEGDGAIAKRVTDDTHTLGSKIELDDEMSSSYLVGNGQIAAVTRTAHGSRFTIVVQGRTPAGDGTVGPDDVLRRLLGRRWHALRERGVHRHLRRLRRRARAGEPDSRPRGQRGPQRPHAHPLGARSARNRSRVVRSAARLRGRHRPRARRGGRGERTDRREAGGSSPRPSSRPASRTTTASPSSMRDVEPDPAVERRHGRGVFTLGLTKRHRRRRYERHPIRRWSSRLPKIGYQRTLSAEGILSLRPSLVVGSQIAGPRDGDRSAPLGGGPRPVIPDFRGARRRLAQAPGAGEALGVPEAWRAPRERGRPARSR